MPARAAAAGLAIGEPLPYTPLALLLGAMAENRGIRFLIRGEL